MCYQDKLIDACKCGDIIAPSLRNASFCEKVDELICQKMLNAYFTMSDINSICDNACPEQCNMVKYDLKLSKTSFPTKNYLKIFSSNEGQVFFSNNSFYTPLWANSFPKNISEETMIEFARQTFIKMKINYDSLYYTVINEKPIMDLNSLIGTVGGQFGS